jgi:hypothetical protein
MITITIVTFEFKKHTCTAQSFQSARSDSASSALNSHVNGGVPVLGLFLGTCTVLAVKGSHYASVY